MQGGVCHGFSCRFFIHLTAGCRERERKMMKTHNWGTVGVLSFLQQRKDSSDETGVILSTLHPPRNCSGLVPPGRPANGGGPDL